MQSVQSSNLVRELESKLKQASDEYYNGTPSVTDEVYDAWRDQLLELQPDSPIVQAIGASPTSEWVKVRHLVPMGSLDKVQTPEELTSWLSKVCRGSSRLLGTEKLDGISVSLRFEKGKLVQALTRGDGQIGEDITINVLRMKGVPSQIPVEDLFLVRGEIVLLKEDHKRHFPDKANPRNAASGTAKRYDGQGSEHLSVLVYQIVEGSDLTSEDTHYTLLKSLGFQVPAWRVLSTAQEVIDLWTEYESVLRERLPYEIDGLVVRLDDISYQLGLGDVHGRPVGAVAFKFTPPASETTLRDILWQVGNTGRITPVAVFDSVNLLGAEVSRASLYTFAYIETLGLDIGAKILVVRANDVIPRVSQVLQSVGTVAKAPQTCPCCGTLTVRDGEYLVCPNTVDCQAQAVGRLKQWVSELNILEWGDRLLQNLVDSGQVTTVADLYRLRKESLASLDRMGEKSAENVLKTLWASTPMALENFLGALNIPLCATSIVRLVVDAGYDTLDKIQGASVEQLQAVGGLGPKRAEAIFRGLRRYAVVIEDLLKAGVSIKQRAVGGLSGKSVCFTGKSVRKRAELEQMAVNAGCAVKGSVGKGLTYLVMAELDSTSSKAQAALKNGTLCISEEAFVELCK